MTNVSSRQLLEIIGAQRVENIALTEQLNEQARALARGCQAECCTNKQPEPEAE